MNRRSFLQLTTNSTFGILLLPERLLAANESEPLFKISLAQWSLNKTLRAGRMTLRREVETLVRARRDEYPHWAVPALGIHFGEKLFRRLRRKGLHGPLWQHARTLMPGSRPSLRAGAGPGFPARGR